MPRTHDVQATGDRIETLLAEFGALGDAAARAKAEELVRELMALYGAALERVVEIVVESGAAAALRGLTADRLVSALLVLHDLHPLSTDERVRAALDEVRPFLNLHDGGVELLGVEDGVARLRLSGACHGCPSSRLTVTQAIERAIAHAAPEVRRVNVEGVAGAPEPLLHITSRPAGTHRPSPPPEPEPPPEPIPPLEPIPPSGPAPPPGPIPPQPPPGPAPPGPMPPAPAAPGPAGRRPAGPSASKPTQPPEPPYEPAPSGNRPPGRIPPGPCPVPPE